MTTVRNSIRTSRVRVLAVVGLGVLLALLLSADGIATAYTEWLWFSDLGLGSVWTRRVGTQIGLVAAFSIAFFVLLWGNLLLADRISRAAGTMAGSGSGPAIPPPGEEDLVVRYQRLIRGRAGRIRVILCAVLALVAGGNTASQWQEWLLFRNAVGFQKQDELFHRDIGFYLFRLPFLTFVLDWLFAALILTLVVVAVAHYLNGGIRPSGPTGRVGSGVGAGVKAHLSALLAALAVVRAVGYWFDRFQLVNSTRGAYDGALATAVNIQWPAYNLLVLVSLFVAALFLANLRRQGWGLPMVAIGLWVASHALVGSAFPALYQRLRVESQASTREKEYVGRNIEATRFAYGLDDDRLSVEPLAYHTGVTEAEVADFAPVLATVPLLDPGLARDSFNLSQVEAAYYRFSDPLDVDRYEIDGQVRPVVLSARGLDLAVSQVSQGWESQHILFTHGYGAVMAAGWEVDPSGRPRFLVQELGDVAVDTSLTEDLAQPRIYFGENFGGYAIVNAARDEVDYTASTEEESAQTRYRDQRGQGGVPLGGVVRRAAFALRFRQLDPLIAPVLTPDSEVIFHRDVTERIRTVAPFLRLDSNPYPVLAGGRIYWVVDAYTTSDDYPYAQRVSADEPDLAGTELAGGLNYVRNSVKAVVDAFDGTVSLYMFDESDPVLQTWDRAFPGLFRDRSEIPADLRDNLRYPEDIFRLQTTVWSTYVVDDAQQLIQGETAWSVAAQPRSEAATGESEAGATPVFMKPQYLLTRLPGEETTEYVLQRAFVPRSVSGSSNTLELTGVMVARSDPDRLGDLALYTIPSAAGVKSPDFVHSEIRKDDQLTDFVKEKLGSVVSFGEMSLLLMNDTVVYVRPVYVEANSVNAVPELSRVIVVNGDNIQMGATLQEAMDRLVAEQAGVATDPLPTDEGAADQPSTDQPPNVVTPGYDPTGRSLTELLADADQFLAAADGAEAKGDAAQAADLRARARLALDAAQDLLGGTRNGATG